MDKSIIELFKKDLWKDQRELNVIEKTGQIEKNYEDEEELITEISVTDFLNRKKISGIPRIIQNNPLSTIMPYYKGIRLFNLFVELDSLTEKHDDNVSKIKKELIERCENRQHLIQNSLIEWSKKQKRREAYPHAKLKSIVTILANCLGIVVDYQNIEKEIDDINEYWNTVVKVPFRDATTKNMILDSSRLYMENYSSDAERSRYLYESIKSGSYYEWFDASIIDIDFSSCIHNTTFEDDVISLKYHERTWSGIYPKASDILWNGEPNAKRAAITFLIRYFRFGGRKAAYRLIHPTAHRIRFKYDNDIFYFTRLSPIMCKLWPQCTKEYPTLMCFIETVSRYLATTQIVTDSFLEYSDNIKRTYYSDVFPH